MSAFDTPRTIATRRLLRSRLDWTAADEMLEIVFAVLADPDGDMLDAGAAELDLALGKDGHPKSRRDRRALARVIFTSMLDRAK
jgi:hypothetical protein